MSTFADISANGVPIPDASARLSDVEANSPARRSPQVRAAQAVGSKRPDLLKRESSADAVGRAQ